MNQEGADEQVWTGILGIRFIGSMKIKGLQSASCPVQSKFLFAAKSVSRFLICLQRSLLFGP